MWSQNKSAQVARADTKTSTAMQVRAITISQICCVLALDAIVLFTLDTLGETSNKYRTYTATAAAANSTDNTTIVTSARKFIRKAPSAH